MLYVRSAASCASMCATGGPIPLIDTGIMLTLGITTTGVGSWLAILGTVFIGVSIGWQWGIETTSMMGAFLEL